MDITPDHEVLLVDDNPPDLLIGQARLEASPAVSKVMTAMSAAEAMRILKSRRDEGKPLPSLILLDLRMPGEDGFDFLDQFERTFAPEQRPRVAVLTGCASDPDRMRALHYQSVESYLIKPLFQVDVERLFRALARAG